MLYAILNSEIVSFLKVSVVSTKEHIKPCIGLVINSAFLAFGLYHVHSFSSVTEGGVLGMILLLKKWFNISPALSGFVMNTACYLLGYNTFGKKFVGYSMIAAGSFSVAYAVFEQFPPLWPQLAQMPLLAAVVGALFVGIGCGVCVRLGGAPSGDDALAMSLSYITHIQIQWIYLISDLIVLGLSLTYIPIGRIGYSLLTVIISGQLIGLIQKGERERR